MKLCRFLTSVYNYSENIVLHRNNITSCTWIRSYAGTFNVFASKETLRHEIEYTL